MTVVRHLIDLVGTCDQISYVFLDSFRQFQYLIHKLEGCYSFTLVLSVLCSLFLFTSFPTSVYEAHMEYGMTVSPLNLHDGA